jgi:hypothetical protein
LLQAVKSRDVHRLRPLVAPDVWVEHDARGIETFLKVYDLTNPGSQYWKELEDILPLGGKFEPTRNVFCAPFVSCPFPSSLGPDYFVVVGRKVPAYAKDSEQSAVLEQLSCDVLKAGGEGTLGSPPTSTGDWVALWLPSGRWGFVRGSQVRSPFDMAIQISKIQGKWLLTMFTAPD